MKLEFITSAKITTKIECTAVPKQCARSSIRVPIAAIRTSLLSVAIAANSLVEKRSGAWSLCCSAIPRLWYVPVHGAARDSELPSNMRWLNAVRDQLPYGVWEC
jgi:hypothetical protein